MPRPALVILAAGMGTRFGGPKQLTPVGPRGEVIFDYSASSACRAGFGAIVIVTRSEIEDRVHAHVRSWPVAPIVVCQDREPLARRAARVGRTKPLGTAHAALTGMAAVPGSSVGVVNADDLYDRAAYDVLAAHLGHGDPPACALVTFPVSATVIGDRPVTRALCDVDAAMHLRAVEEGTVTGAVWRGRSGRRVALRGDEPVSMNCWGFPGSAAGAFAAGVDAVLSEGDVAAAPEAALPDVVAARVEAGAEVLALAGTGRCIGITHQEDLALVRAAVTEPAW